jgi:hypothetical protein
MSFRLHSIRYGVLLLTGILATVHAVDLTAPVNVPDPFGLGERLALVDYLNEHRIVFRSAQDVQELRRLYLTATTPAVDPKQAEAAAQEEREAERFRQLIAKEFKVDAPKDADVVTLKALRETLASKAQEAERQKLIDILEQDFFLPVAKDATYATIRSIYEQEVRERQARFTRSPAESTASTADKTIETTPTSPSETPGDASPDMDSETPTTPDKPVKASALQPEKPADITLPVSTQRFWDNFASAPSINEKGINLIVYYCDGESGSGTLDVPAEDKWALPIQTRGYSIFVTSGWAIRKTVTIEVDRTQVTISVPAKLSTPAVFIVGGDKKLPFVKLISVR